MSWFRTELIDLRPRENTSLTAELIPILINQCPSFNIYLATKTDCKLTTKRIHALTQDLNFYGVH